MKKKIALLGNMNNSFNAVCRYLLDYGYDAQLFTFDYEIYPHFQPSADCYDDRWKTYTQKLPWGNANTFLKTDRKYLRDFFGEFDVLIGSGYAPAFVQKAGRRLDIFAPHGSDINHLPYLRGYSPKNFGRYLFVGRNQRKGIMNSKHVFSDRWTNDLEKKIKRIPLNGERHYTIIPFLYLPQYQNLKSLPEDLHMARLKVIREQSDLIVFHHIRHSWVNPVDIIALKSNNFLFEAVAKFKERNHGVKISIVTFEYGDDVIHTKNLIEKLRLEDSVEWFSITPRKDIMKMMTLADVVTGEFNYSFVTYGAILEGMAMSKPIMHRRDDALYTDTHQDLYPMVYAASTEDILKGLEDILKYPAKYQAMGEQGNAWMKRNMVEIPMQEMAKVLDAKLI
jgi:hypothetical protein